MIPFNHLGWFFNLCASSAYPKAAVEALCDAIKDVSQDASVLDLGAGTGIMSTYAHNCRDDLRFVAADPSEGMLKYVPAHVRAVTAKAEALPFADNAFDAILLGEALHHFDDPRIAFGEITRVLNAQGVLFIYEFDPSAFLGKTLCLAEKLLGEPGHFFTPDNLKAELEAHGLSVQINRHGWRYSLTSRSI